MFGHHLFSDADLKRLKTNELMAWASTYRWTVAMLYYKFFSLKNSLQSKQYCFESRWPILRKIGRWPVFSFPLKFSARRASRDCGHSSEVTAVYHQLVDAAGSRAAAPPKKYRLIKKCYLTYSKIGHAYYDIFHWLSSYWSSRCRFAYSCPFLPTILLQNSIFEGNIY